MRTSSGSTTPRHLTGDVADGAPPVLAGRPARRIRCRLLGLVDVRTADGSPASALIAQPKRLALFIYLVLRGPNRPARRDSLLALFWPEADETAARHALRQTIHVLRRELGADVLVRQNAGHDVAILGDAVWSDVAELERAVADERHEDALADYRGPLLEGFHVSGVAPGLERVFEDERARLHAIAVASALALTDQAERAGNLPLAIRSARDCVRLAPFDEPALRRLMQLLRRAGDRAGALLAYEAFADRLRSELDVSPSRETAALAEQVRADRGEAGSPHSFPAIVSAAHAEVEAPPAIAAAGLRAPTAVSSRPSSRRLGWILGAAALGTIALAALLVRLRGVSELPAVPVIAVGALRMEAGDTLLSERVFRDLLVTDIARVAGVAVVSAERIDELTVRTGGTRDADSAGVASAALHAGASQMIEGIVSRESGGLLRLDARVVDLRRGVIRGAYRVRAADAFALADSMTAQVAPSLGRTAPATALAEVTTTSLVARRFYAEGIHSLSEGDASAALTMFRAALAEDSTFGMAAYYAASAAWGTLGDSAALPYLAQALRMSRRAPERERLLAASAWAAATNSPARLAFADSLESHFPLEPDADLLLGEALTWAGNRARGIAHLQRVLARDSAGIDAVQRDSLHRGVPCRACWALSDVISAYIEGDSLALAEQLAREWTRRQPSSYNAWSALAQAYELQGRTAEALEVAREGSRRSGRELADAMFRARLAIRDGDYATADRLLRDRAAGGDPGARIDALWWLVISLRNQGRFGEALRSAERLVRDDDAARGYADGGSAARLARAQVLLELGRARDAALAFEAAAVAPLRDLADVSAGGPGSGREARRRTWGLALAATAWAAGGDTTRIRALVDRITSSGAASAYGRDQRLPSYVRGLLFEFRHEYADAERAYRAAMWSPNVGYTGVNVALARVLVLQHRPREAAEVLQAALRGSLEGSNYYVTRTVLRRTLRELASE